MQQLEMEAAIAVINKSLRFCPLQGTLWNVEGTIGAGKSTLCDRIASVLRESGMACTPRLEQANGLMLELFYTNPKKYAFVMQMMMLLQCLANHQHTSQFLQSTGHAVGIVDRGVWGHANFELMHVDAHNLSADEHEIYLHELEKGAAYPVTAVLYVDITPELALQRVKHRERDGENSITLEYLTKLDGYYCQQVMQHTLDGTSNVLVLIDRGGFLDARNTLHVMADYLVALGRGTRPGLAWLKMHAKSYEDSDEFNFHWFDNAQRRDFMQRLSTAQLQDIRDAVSSPAEAVSTTLARDALERQAAFIMCG